MTGTRVVDLSPLVSGDVVNVVPEVDVKVKAASPEDPEEAIEATRRGSETIALANRIYTADNLHLPGYPLA